MELFCNENVSKVIYMLLVEASYFLESIDWVDIVVFDSSFSG